MLNSQKAQHILQVSELTKKVRFMLESELNRVWLCGEISNFVAASSGHWYLSLKDSRSQVKCAMFKGNNSKVRLSPRNGQQVLIRAKVSLYEPRGDFQLIIEQMEDAGEGLLRQQFEQLKQKLNAQGLFSTAHKQAIPEHVKTVGIVTSPTGAAVNDILTTLARRNPQVNVIIYPALVQGQQAAQAITDAIITANHRQECDVLIVGRGGGSLEDLWSFNEESVVHAIYHSVIPIISAVGHEVDTTLADYVADLRAATPTAAAELAAQDTRELSEKIAHLHQRLLQQSQHSINNRKQLLVHTQHRLLQVEPAQLLQLQQQKADELTTRLKQVISRELTRFARHPQQLATTLQHLSPKHYIEKNAVRQQQLKQRLINIVTSQQQQRQARFLHIIEQLQLVSPLATIARGYNVARNKKGVVVQKVNQVTIDEEITLQVSDGTILTKVINISEVNDVVQAVD